MRRVEASHEDVSQSLPVLKALVQALSAKPEIDRVILFGSRARGDADDRSDIDLAVAASRATPRQWIEISILAEDAPTLLSVNLVRLDGAPAALRSEILSAGKTLYERSEDGTKSEESGTLA